jgi:hypothetical protein
MAKPTNERLEQLCREGYDALRAGPDSKEWSTVFDQLLHPDVELYDYDHGAHFEHEEGKADVLERLRTVIYPEFEEFDRQPRIEALDGMVVIRDCSRMVPGHGESPERRKKTEEHCCVDLVKFEGEQVREIHYCVVSEDVPATDVTAT